MNSFKYNYQILFRFLIKEWSITQNTRLSRQHMATISNLRYPVRKYLIMQQVTNRINQTFLLPLTQKAVPNKLFFKNKSILFYLIKLIFKA